MFMGIERSPAGRVGSQSSAALPSASANFGREGSVSAPVLWRGRRRCVVAGSSGGGANMGRMGLPEKDRAEQERRARARLVRDGRPLRMRTLCVMLGQDAEVWRQLSKDEQQQALAPFMDEEREAFRFSNAGELFIIDAALGHAPVEQSEVSGVSLERIQSTRATERAMEKFHSKLSREAFAQGFAAATRHLVPMLVELDERMISEALDEDATDAAKDRGVRVAKELKDRLGGRAVQGVEDVGTDGERDIRKFVASRRPSVMPASAGISIEDVGRETQRQLEAGELVIDDEA